MRESNPGFSPHSLCPRLLLALLAAALQAAMGAACSNGSPAVPWACQIPAGDAPDAVPQIGCPEDFQALASEPLAPSIPGARSVKTSIDREADNALQFQNSVRFPVHWDFLSKHRSAGQGLPRVPVLDQFNRSEYYSPSRRFLLGALTYYDGPNKWAYEIAPYDTSDAAMIRSAYEQIQRSTFLGRELYFHPTSLNVESVAEALPGSVQRLTTDELFQGTEYQALNLGESIGRLRFVPAAQLEQSYVTYRDIVVLDHVPNDISVTQGIITAEFQTPLSHINVLSQNRGTPNMGLRGASTNAKLKALDGKWVELAVESSGWTVREVTMAEADSYWQA
ncbi:MAG TPA: hypothetical protein VJU61_05100, partial [Polyangiaceae bacterium]|nr:hypothetical protein [Polyangiaceae bacterium]